MTEQEAYEQAIEHMRKTGVDYRECLCKGVCSGADTLGLRISAFPDGPRRKVWCFTFAVAPPLPPTLLSEGEKVVCVVDDTGLCGYFVTL